MGEMLCGRCSLVISDKIQETLLEVHSFNIKEINDTSRTGMPFSLANHDMGLSRIIGKTDRDAYGHQLDKSMHDKMDRLGVWDFRSQIYSPTAINLYGAFHELYRLKDKLGLSNAVLP